MPTPPGQRGFGRILTCAFLLLSAERVSGTNGVDDPAVVFAAPDVVGLTVSPDGIGLGDTDADGLADVCIPWDWFDCSEGCSWDDGLHVLPGQGNGSFPASADFDHPFQLFEVVDLDSDGSPDLVGSLPNSKGLMVQLQAFTATPKPVEEYGQSAPQSFALTDLDLDGDLDVAWTRSTGGNSPPHVVDVRFNAGDGTYQAGYGYAIAPEGGARAFDIAAGDLDGNGLPDLCTIRQSTIASDSFVHVVIGLGQGAVAGTGIYWAGAGARQTHVQDLDADGWMDVAVSLVPESRVQVLRSLGNGTLAMGWDASVAQSPQWLHLGDLDGDGDADMLTGSTEGPVGLVLALGPASYSAPFTLPWPPIAKHRAVGDLNLDGAVDLLVTWLGVGGGLLVHRNLTAAWQDLGYALPGAQGTPYLGVQGEPQPGGAIAARLVAAEPGALVALFLGSSISAQPFLGGVLAPMPQLVVFPLATDSAGEIVLDATWPGDVLPGTPVVSQAWVLPPNGAAPSASNAVGVNLP